MGKLTDNEEYEGFKNLCDSHKKLYEALCIIESNPLKKIKSDKFEADEYIYYDRAKREFKYEDGCYLGNDPIDIIQMFATESWFRWSFDAKWFVC